MTLLTVTYGKENFSKPNCTAELKTFYQTSSISQKTHTIYDIARKTVAKEYHLNSTKKYDASNINRLQGSWNEVDLYVPDNSFCTIIFNKSAQTGFASSCILTLMCNENAPMNQLEFKLTGHPFASIKTAMFEGRFVVLQKSELEANGVKLTPYQKNFYSKLENIGLHVRLTELRPAKAGIKQNIILESKNSGKRILVNPNVGRKIKL
jgi:hypothetical protein